MTRPPFRKILVANRGEIALRIIRTCRELGIATVAVHSDVDARTPHVRAATESYPIGPPESAKSYLVIDKILDVARKSGAEAIHPGYGFLSENARFARAVSDAGLVFIGPPPDAIAAMGDKVEARRRAQAAGAPIVPGTPGGVSTPEEAKERAAAIGFPLLVKAAAGVGGKGMRVVRSAGDLEAALRQASSEATKAFGDGTVYFERYLERPRHVEIQVFGDGHGRVVHLGERDCSIQRRHQKLIEESPSPALDPELRARMGEVAVRIAKSVGYVGAGTMEFLLDSDRRFYFLEMNTRLQVEHPVTEMVSGYDLVAEQIHVAGGGRLRFPEEPFEPRGAALECRIYAEDPDAGFAPSPGPVVGLTVPEGPYVRVDSGVQSGDVVTSYYDPMISKLVTWGHTRAEAIRRMKRALLEYLVVGIRTNIPFHRFALDDEVFLSGDYSIRFIEERFEAKKLVRPDAALAARIACLLAETAAAARTAPAAGGEGGTSYWNLSARQNRRWR